MCIRDRHDAVAVVEHVARVHVGMHEAVGEYHLQYDLRADAREPLLVTLHATDVAAAHAVDELHREHARRRERPLDAREADARDAAEALREALRVRRLLPEVELPSERLGEALAG